MTTLLRVEGLTRLFGGLVAVNKVDFDVEEGKIIAIIGPNGAGKSTLFNLIGGTISPSSGKVFFAGNDITGWKPYSIARAGIARTFQTTALFEELPVYVNLVIGHRMRTRSGLWDVILHTPRQKREKNETTAKVLEVLEFTELGEYINAPAGSIPRRPRSGWPSAWPSWAIPGCSFWTSPRAGWGWERRTTSSPSLTAYAPRASPSASSNTRCA